MTRVRYLGPRAALGAAVLTCLLLLTSTAFAVEFTTNTTITSGDYSGEAIIVTGCTLTIDCSGGVGSYASLLVRSNGVVTHPAGSENGLWLQFTGNVDVESGSSINVDGRGYPKQSGPGGGVSGAGGSYGGTGGYGGPAVYGSITAPTQLGSGGGDGNGGEGLPGGGAIRLEVGGTLTVDGTLTADGHVYTNRAGGSGGSIFLTAGTIAGAGTIKANGGSNTATSYDHGGGGGGRIAVLYDTDTFSGAVSATGGLGRSSNESHNGGAGTIYSKGSSDSFGTLVYDNGGIAGWTLQPALNMTTTDVVVSNGLLSVDCSGGAMSLRNLTVGPSATVSHPAVNESGLYVVVSGNVTVEATATLNTDGRGYPKQSGPGGGVSGAGGSHGGTGGYGGPAVYGSITAPTQLGSGGGDGNGGNGLPGGGAIRLEVGGTLTVDGTLTADGHVDTNRAGGSGGSIFLTAGTIAGAGTIKANGGSNTATSYDHGGGGGGRVAVLFDTNTFSGAVSATGGLGRSSSESHNGGAGTVYSKDSADTFGTLVYDNAGRAGWTLQPALNMTTTDVVVSNGLLSVDCSGGPMSLRNLTVGPSATVSHPAVSESGLYVVVSGSMSVQATATLDTDGRGYPANVGPGGGVSGAGGSHGGTGGYGGPAVYGSITAPTQLGSGGGDGNGGNGLPGGGAIRLEVGGTLTVDGSLTADGHVATNRSGGSGGTVFLTVGTIAGAGTIKANGGSNSGSSYDHGGGGGGRIAIVYDTDTFSGAVTAKGGLGRSSIVANNGGPGTIYRKKTSDSHGTLLFDNFEIVGWTTQPALDMDTTDIVVQNTKGSGGYCGLTLDCTLNPVRARNFTVGPYGALTHAGGDEAGLYVQVGADMSIASGGVIDVDGRGYGAGQGPGGGMAGAGASYGGTGGYGGPAVYGSITAPTHLGSGGANGDGGAGLPGGGAIRLEVGGTLTVDGTLTADGLVVSNRPAGSGGSIYLTAGTLAGAGSMTADGGSDTSNSYHHGGGGGGRIAVHYGADTYSGTASALGGLGRASLEPNNAGPGTIYSKQTGGARSVTDEVVFDNGGRTGWTLQPAFSMPDTALITSNARVRFDCSSQAVHVRALDVRSGSILSHPAANEAGLAFNVEAEANIASGATLEASVLGYAATSGPGGGADRAGGSYGGRGGRGGPDTYGIADMPAFLGSGGGNSSGGYAGGSGGGMLTLLAAGSVNIDGHMLANAQSASNAGGGSGGSIRVAALSLTGTGIIAADGGVSTGVTYPSGGGGGGRVGLYVHPGQASFPSGTVTVAGGTGVGGDGEVGTIYRGDTYTLPDLSFIAAHSEFHWDLEGNGEANLRVVNWGLADTSSVRVELFNGNPANPGSVSLGHTTIGALGRLTSVLATIPVAPQALTDIWAVVDPAGDIGEGNETNNALVFSAVRTPTSLYVQDRTGTIGEVTPIRGWLKRLSDNAWLPGRTVTYKVDGSFIGTAVTDSNGKAEMLWTITNGPASRTINGSWPGDDTYAPSAGNGTLTAQTWQTKMNGVNRTGPIASYRILKAWLWKMDNTPIPGKSILFKLDGTVLGSDNTRATGYAQIGYTIADGAGAGDREIRAEWAGDGGYLPSSCTNTLTVTKATPYIWVMPRTVVQGGIARFYAYFRRLPDYQKQAGKTISFKIDGTWIVDVVTLSGAEAGIARYNYTTVESVGDHTLRAEFAGDAWVDAGYGEALLRILAP